MKVRVECDLGMGTREFFCYGSCVSRVWSVLAAWGFAGEVISAQKTIESRITRLTRREKLELLAELKWPEKDRGLLFDV